MYERLDAFLAEGKTKDERDADEGMGLLDRVRVSSKKRSRASLRGMDPEALAVKRMDDAAKRGGVAGMLNATRARIGRTKSADKLMGISQACETLAKELKAISKLAKAAASQVESVQHGGETIEESSRIMPHAPRMSAEDAQMIPQRIERVVSDVASQAGMSGPAELHGYLKGARASEAQQLATSFAGALHVLLGKVGRPMTPSEAELVLRSVVDKLASEMSDTTWRSGYLKGQRKVMSKRGEPFDDAAMKKVMVPKPNSHAARQQYIRAMDLVAKKYTGSPLISPDRAGAMFRESAGERTRRQARAHTRDLLEARRAEGLALSSLKRIMTFIERVYSVSVLGQGADAPDLSPGVDSDDNSVERLARLLGDIDEFLTGSRDARGDADLSAFERVAGGQAVEFDLSQEGCSLLIDPMARVVDLACDDEMSGRAAKERFDSIRSMAGIHTTRADHKPAVGVFRAMDDFNAIFQ